MTGTPVFSVTEGDSSYTSGYTPVQLDLTGQVEDGNELLVEIFPVPKKQDAPPGRRQATSSSSAPRTAS